MSRTLVTLTYCVGGGLAIQIPFAIWFGIVVIGFFYSGELALLCLSLTYYPQLYMNYVLKQALQLPYPDNGCREGLDAPCLECQLAASFAVFVLLFNALRGIRAKLLTLLIMIGLWFGVPAVLVWSGNSGQLSSLLGWALGSLIGVLTALVIHLYLSPHFDQALLWLPLRKLGYKNTLYHCGEALLHPPARQLMSQLLPPPINK